MVTRVHFTTPLIEDAPRYYRLTRRQWFLFFLNGIPAALLIGFFFSSYPISWWVAVPAIVAYIGMAVWMKKNQHSLQATVIEHTLVLDEKTVTITETGGKAHRTYDLNEVDRIIVKKEFGIPGESLADLSQELWGKPKRNFLILERDGKQQQLDFVIDSYYGITQLEKLIDRWREKGYRVERS